MVDTGWAIPRRTKIPFHVGIVGKKLSVLIKGGIKWVPESVGDHFDFLSILIGLENESTGSHFATGVAITVPHAGKEVIFGPHASRPRTIKRSGFVGVVTKNEVERFAIRAWNDAVEAVFATPFELSQELLFVELPVVVGIAESIQAPGSLLFVLEKVEGTVNITKSMRPLNFGAEFFDFGFHLIDRNPIKTAVLVPGDQSALRIHCHRDPGSLLAFWNGVEQVGLKPGKSHHFA